jgi:hypothetical protein
MADVQTVRAREAERAAISGTCAHCDEPFTGRRDKKFCSDKCRTAFGRVETARHRDVERRRVEQAVEVLRAALDDVRRLLPGGRL